MAYTNDSSPILYSPDTARRSVIDCGVACYALSSCFGFMFDNSVKKCVLLGCFNPYLFNGSQTCYYLPMSTLLARGGLSWVVVIFLPLINYFEICDAINVDTLETEQWKWIEHNTEIDHPAPVSLQDNF